MEIIFPRGDAPEKVAKNSVAVGTIKREQEVKEDGREEKPGRPLSVIYADAKQAITRQVGNTMAAYGLPIFMAEGILSGVLAEIRSNAANELADDTARYEEELKEYYETEAKEKQETFEKEKEELITLFENPEEVPGASEENVAGEEPVIEEVE